jgi:hypothetical protein
MPQLPTPGFAVIANHSVGNFHATRQTVRGLPRAACILLDGINFFAIFSSWSSNGKIDACCLGPDAHEVAMARETPYSQEVRPMYTR